MTTRRSKALAAVVGVVLLGVAAALSALAIDLARVNSGLVDADVRFTTRAQRATTWTPGTILPTGIATGLLGIDDDVRFRKAVQRFWASEPRAELRQFADVTRRAGAERDLAELADTDADPGRRAILAIMRGALLLEEARNSPNQRDVFVRRAIEQYQKAVDLDPTNPSAAYDLELSLKLLRRSGSGDAPGGDARSPLPSPGAGAATSGTGF